MNNLNVLFYVFNCGHERAIGCTNDFQYQNWGVLRYSILFEHNKSSTWLAHQPICGEQKKKKYHLHHAKDNPEVTTCLFYSALNERTLAVNWKIKSSIIKPLQDDPLCGIMYQKHCGLPSKFILQPQSMILTHSYLEPLRKSKGRLAECHIIIIMGKSIDSAS